jgi:signal transduction histidine kinase/DNA-binding NarL/FixJ family response regulator
MNRPNVLIVKTSISDINEIETLLSDCNIEMVKANSETEAVELAKKIEFALVLLETDPLKVDCFEFAKEIRKNQKYEHLNILYITDDCCEVYTNNEFPLLTGVDVIARPFVRWVLKDKVERLVRQFIDRKNLEEELLQRRIIEEELIKSRKQEEKAGKAKTQFLSTMSHEIRTPLNAIINTINLLISEGPRKDQVKDMEVLKFSADTLLQMINEILDYSKIDSGKIEFEEIDFNIHKLISKIKQSLQFGIVKNGNTLDFFVEDDVPDFIVGDSVRLAQILFNLIGNALKFTENGKVTFTTEVSQEYDDNIELRFRISDTGIGIPEEKLSDIFDAFTQANAATTREFGGTGLGLAITKMLVEKQGGHIEVSSKPNVGSTFLVYLKFKRSNKNEHDEIPEKLAEIQSLDGLKILVVEDNLINQSVVTRLLTNWNAITDTADNGRIAVGKIIENHYELVLMDLNMPEMSGYEATRKIREMEGNYFKKIPILAVTASAFVEDRKKILASGMNGYIIKPFHPVELNSKISRFLNRDMLV